MNNMHLFIKEGFKIEKKRKPTDNSIYYEITSPDFEKFEVNSLKELTKEKYETLKMSK